MGLMVALTAKSGTTATNNRVNISVSSRTGSILAASKLFARRGIVAVKTKGWLPAAGSSQRIRLLRMHTLVTPTTIQRGTIGIR